MRDDDDDDNDDVRAARIELFKSASKVLGVLATGIVLWTQAQSEAIKAQTQAIRVGAQQAIIAERDRQALWATIEQLQTRLRWVEQQTGVPAIPLPAVQRAVSPPTSAEVEARVAEDMLGSP